jgi:hypothetical protein
MLFMVTGERWHWKKKSNQFPLFGVSGDLQNCRNIWKVLKWKTDKIFSVVDFFHIEYFTGKYLGLRLEGYYCTFSLSLMHRLNLNQVWNFHVTLLFVMLPRDHPFSRFLYFTTAGVKCCVVAVKSCTVFHSRFLYILFELFFSICQNNMDGQTKQNRKKFLP